MGGLASLPIPDAMFDEPDNGGYASGGLVAFAAGDEVDGGVDGGEMRVIAPEEEEEGLDLALHGVDPAGG